MYSRRMRQFAIHATVAYVRVAQIASDLIFAKTASENPPAVLTIVRL